MDATNDRPWLNGWTGSTPAAAAASAAAVPAAQRQPLDRGAASDPESGAARRTEPPQGADPEPAPILVFDGGCLFCRHFAELSELRAGIPGLRIRDGRADQPLRHRLAEQGWHLRDGAMVLIGDRVLHGADAIAWICGRMAPSAALLAVLAPLLGDGPRARRLYPLLLLARRLALAVRGLPVDPDHG